MPGVDGWVGGGHTTVLSPDQHIPLPRVSKNHRLKLKECSIILWILHVWGYQIWSRWYMIDLITIDRLWSQHRTILTRPWPFGRMKLSFSCMKTIFQMTLVSNKLYIQRTIAEWTAIKKDRIASLCCLKITT